MITDLIVIMLIIVLIIGAVIECYYTYCYRKYVKQLEEQNKILKDIITLKNPMVENVINNS